MLTNLNNLKDTLSGMDLQGLQDYARVNKNDPYVVSMALSMANTLKKMDVAKKGQAGMQPQPKVVDQQIAQMVAPPPQQMAAAPQQQMLPEDVGIGQLPAQNMQNMAGGGIVAFEEGGDVPGYAAGVFTGEEEMPEWLKAFPPESGLRRVYRAAKQYDKNNPQPVIPKVVANPSGPFDYPAGAKVAPPAPPAPPSSAAIAKPPPAVPVAAAAKPAAPAAPVPAAPVPAAAPVDLMSGITALNTKPMTPAEAMAASKTFGTGEELTTGINQLRSDTIKSNEDLSRAYKEGLAGLAKPGEQAEERLRQREAEDVVSKADAKAMAIFKAGLGMMAGTSQNAFENIGKGAMAGLEDYSASIKDFRKLAIERDKAYAEIEAARNAALRDDFKTSVGLQEKAADRLARVNEKGIEITATLFKTNKDAASNIWNTSTTLASANARSANEMQMQANKSVFEQSAQAQRDVANNAAALERTRMQVNAPSAEERVLSNDKLFKKKMELLTAGTDSKGINAFALEALKDPSLLPRLEAGSAQDRQLAASIKQYMQGMMINPVNVPKDTPMRP
jgi:hypothetical protein